MMVLTLYSVGCRYHIRAKGFLRTFNSNVAFRSSALLFFVSIVLSELQDRIKTNMLWKICYVLEGC